MTRKTLTSSQDRWWGRHTIERDGDPYMTRYWIGRLRLHVFHRGDHDPDPHDHPWDFWTFPLTSYVEEVAHRVPGSGSKFSLGRYVVKAWRPHFRPAEHTHRVLGRFAGTYACGVDHRPGGSVSWRSPMADDGKIVTLVWQCGVRRKWGFLKNRDGRWCWQAWREYVREGGKSAPCE